VTKYQYTIQHVQHRGLQDTRMTYLHFGCTVLDCMSVVVIAPLKCLNVH